MAKRKSAIDRIRERSPEFRIVYRVVVKRRCGHETEHPMTLPLGRLRKLAEAVCEDCRD